MSTQVSKGDPWRWPILALWFIFFLLGLWPELSYYGLRSAGYVFSQNAIINSYHFITWCLTGFVMHFAYHRSLEGGLPPVEALGKAIQLGVLAFVAFVDLPFEQILLIRNTIDQVLVIGTAFGKLLAWFYLFSLIVRYYRYHNPEVITHSLSWLVLTLTPNAGDKREQGGNGSDSTTSTTPHPPMKEQAD